MALTKEQFGELRKKGLTPQQIADFEAGKKPTVSIEAREPVKLWDTSGFTAPFKGAAKEIGKIGLGIGTIGRSFQEGAARLIGKDLAETSIFDKDSQSRQSANTALEQKGFGEKFGGFLTGTLASAMPSGGALNTIKATKGLGFATKMLGMGGVGAVTGTVQGGGNLDRDTAIGALSEVAFPIAGKAIGYGGNVLKGLAGMVSGKGADVIEQVVKTPRAALEGAETLGTAGLRETATNIRQGVKSLRQKAGGEFEALTAPYTKPLGKGGLKTVVDNFLTDDVDAIITKTGLDLEDTPFLDADAKKIERVYNIVNKWEDTSPQGINKLASKISKFYKGSESSQDVDRVVSGLNRRIRDWIGEQVPDIAQANSKYADKMDLIDQMEAIFRTKGSVESRAGMQKTAEAVGRLFNANKDLAREGVEEIEKELGINILGKEAGRQLVDGVSRSQSAIGDFATGVGRALLPPKLVLQVAARTGIAKEAIESRLNILEPAARGIVLEVLTDLFGEGEIENPE